MRTAKKIRSVRLEPAPVAPSGSVDSVRAQLQTLIVFPSRRCAMDFHAGRSHDRPAIFFLQANLSFLGLELRAIKCESALRGASISVSEPRAVATGSYANSA